MYYSCSGLPKERNLADADVNQQKKLIQIALSGVETKQAEVDRAREAKTRLHWKRENAIDDQVNKYELSAR